MLKKWQIEKLESLDGWGEFCISKKQYLLELARSGGEKPKPKTKLAHCLISYMREKSVAYDPEFTKQIKKLRPDWFVDKSDLKKEQLLQMAKSGERRPRRGTPIEACLRNYTHHSSSSYDPQFTKQIKKLRPDWFVLENPATLKKEEILKLAKSGAARPTGLLGQKLSVYMRKTHYNRCYDPKFTKQIKKLRPDWFADKANLKKEQLLQMAKKGERPNSKTPLYTFLCTRTNKNFNTYNPKFTKQIKKLRPDWVISQFDKVKEKKQQLLQMAKSGKKKPLQQVELGRSLYRYICKAANTYDPEFTKQIKKLRPDWFRNVGRPKRL